MPAVTYPVLRRAEQALILILALAVFLFIQGPVWRRFADWDGSILWSYAVIPTLVAGALVVKRRWAWAPWFLHSLVLALVKFAVTALFLVGVLALNWDVHLPRLLAPAPPAGPQLAPAAPRVVPRDANGGRVAGRAPPGAWVWVEGVRSPATALPPTDPVRFGAGPQGFDPPTAVVMVGQPLVVRSTDGRLHTARLKGGGQWLLNVPVPAAGWSDPRAPKQPAEGELGCTVHDRQEPKARVLVVNHPFFAQAGADGGFAIEGVPPGAAGLRAFTLNGSWDGGTVQVERGKDVVVQIDLTSE